MQSFNELGVNAQNLLAEFEPGMGSMKLIKISSTRYSSMWTNDPRPHPWLHFHNGFGDDMPAIQELAAAGMLRIDDTPHMPSVELTEIGSACWINQFSSKWDQVQPESNR